MIVCPICQKDITKTGIGIYQAVARYNCESCHVTIRLTNEHYYDNESEFEYLVDTIKGSMLHDSESFEAGEECYTEQLAVMLGVTNNTLSRVLVAINKRREEYQKYGRDAKLIEGCLHILGHIDLKDWAEGCLDIIRDGLAYEDKSVGVVERALMCVENSGSEVMLHEIKDIEIKTDWIRKYRNQILRGYNIEA